MIQGPEEFFLQRNRDFDLYISRSMLVLLSLRG